MLFRGLEQKAGEKSQDYEFSNVNEVVMLSGAV